MKKRFNLEGLECANCAAKMEVAIGKLDGVNSVNINFLAEKLVIDVEEEKLEEVLEAAQKEITKLERFCKIVR